MPRQRTCEECGRPFTPRNGLNRRCPEHEYHGVDHRSPTTRAQDAEYRRARARILASHPPCHYCGEPATTVDHQVAVVNGGGVDGNLVPCCASCNNRKQGRGSVSVLPERAARRPASPPIGVRLT